MTAGDLSIVYMPLDELVPDDWNPKGHAIAELRASIGRFGFAEAIVVDGRTGKLAAGHGRVEALAEMHSLDVERPPGIQGNAATGQWFAPVQVGWSSKNDEEAHAFLIAANRTTELGGWDDRALVRILSQLDAGPGFAGVGYDSKELVQFMARISTPTIADEPEANEQRPPAPAFTSPGDVWQLGSHRIMCGDARSPRDMRKLVGRRKVNLAVTSPPYADRRKYDESSGFTPIDPDEYVDWFGPISANVGSHLAADGSWLVNIKPGAEGLDTDLYVHDLVAAHVRLWGWHFATEFAWERNGVPKGPVQRLKNQFEPVYQFTLGRWKFRPENVRHPSSDVPTNVGPGGGDTSWDRQQGNGAFLRPEQLRKGRRNGSRGTVPEEQGSNWQPGEATFEGLAYPGNRLPTFIGSHEATGHTAAFPVGLPQFFARLFTDVGDVVLDPFLGSGSSILAAHAEGRIGLGMEISPAYCDTTCRRFEEHTGIIPVRNGVPVSFLTDTA